MATLELGSADIAVTIDPDRGADILSLVHRPTGVDVLFRTPWREHADAVCAGRTPASLDPDAVWLEHYRGGWQTLFPNAGPARSVCGAPVPFHGEASVVPWEVDSVSADAATLHVDLFSVPVRIERTVRLAGATATVEDRLLNRSGAGLDVDYVQHPAFGGEFLSGDVRIETGARRFTSDPGSTDRSAGSVFGWLHDFSEHRASIVNRDLGLAAHVAWDGERLPYAWFWQELNATATFPWYQRARVVAIEPASTTTSGPGRRSTLRLDPGADVTLTMSISLEDGMDDGRA
ncbi:hypothetical protein ACFRFH_04795 [Leifsonia sp. NPDC056824]|uniref:hypothetical protein n=1 Tax=Leifsonia sp. NPDC056824 TaxID=3345953 RepID=UPI003674A787